MESTLLYDMKDKIKSRLLDTVFNTTTFTDPRFEDTFVTMEEETKVILLEEKK